MRFDSYHPAINLIYFTAVIAAAAVFQHPAFLAAAYFCAFVYSVKLNGLRAFVFNLCLVPLIAAWALWYGYYHHFGVTALRQNMIGNTITLEAIVYGGTLGIRGASIVMWFSCLHSIFSSDKVVYLFGRVSPRLSLFLSILLRMVPRIRRQAARISMAQRCIGRGPDQGNILRRMQNRIRIFSVLITWLIESAAQISDSMRSRGHSLRGRTAFSIYRFDVRDRTLVIVMFLCIAVVMTGVLFDQTHILYNPRIVMNRVTPLSHAFYGAYTVFCLLPPLLQTVGERRFEHSAAKHSPKEQAVRFHELPDQQT